MFINVCQCLSMFINGLGECRKFALGKRTTRNPVIFDSLRLSEQVIQIGGTTHRDNPFTP